MSIREQFEATIPAHWLYYLTYGEDDTMDVSEKNHIGRVCHGWYAIDSGDDESYFTNSFDVYSHYFESGVTGGDVIDVTYMKLPE